MFAPSVAEKLVRLSVILIVLCCLVVFVCLFTRLTALAFAVLSVIPLVFASPLRRRGVLLCVLAVFLLLSVMPFDVRLAFRHRLPKMKRLVYGLPSKRGMEAAQRGEVILGGCMQPSGYEPTWIFEW